MSNATLLAHSHEFLWVNLSLIGRSHGYTKFLTLSNLIGLVTSCLYLQEDMHYTYLYL
jgi:hypothetical protein